MNKSIAIRSLFGGALMGLANLVPGISGGTMLLASGVYPNFIKAVAGLSTGKLQRDYMITVALIGGSAAVAILFLAGSVRDLVLAHRWVMYSLFIGLTLGGVPLLYALLKGRIRESIGSISIGLVLMVAIALIQNFVQSDSSHDHWILMFVAGVAGASAMILPGISGSYLLLLLGVYVPILTAIDRLKESLSERDVDMIISTGFSVILPVGLGVLIGVVVVSQLLKKLLEKRETQTYAVLLGVLLGAVFGLWPFQQTLPLEEVGKVKGQQVEVFEGQLHYHGSQKLVKPKDIPTQAVLPSGAQSAAGLALVLAGFGLTMGLARFSEDK